MKKISFQQLAAVAASAMVLGLSATEILVGFGFAFPTSPNSLALTLIVIGLGVFLASLPIARYRRARERGIFAKRPNPFVAFRILVFARAATITACGFLGWYLGQLAWLWIFGSLVQSLLFATLVGAGAAATLLLAGYLAELNCRAPKDSDGEAES